MTKQNASVFIELAANANQLDFNLSEKLNYYKYTHISIEKQYELFNDKQKTILAWKKLKEFKQTFVNTEDIYEMGQLYFYTLKIKLWETEPLDLYSIMILNESDVIKSYKHIDEPDKFNKLNKLNKPNNTIKCSSICIII
jgi:hypothetical protein